MARFLCPILSQATPPSHTHYENLTFGSQTDRSLHSALTNLDDRKKCHLFTSHRGRVLPKQLTHRISSMLILIFPLLRLYFVSQLSASFTVMRHYNSKHIGSFRI